MEEYIYNAAVESIHKYKEEELTDFDDFMDEIEKEYESY
jgi:hypothetical protein